MAQRIKNDAIGKAKTRDEATCPVSTCAFAVNKANRVFYLLRISYGACVTPLMTNPQGLIETGKDRRSTIKG